MRIKYTIPLVGIICAIFLCITVFVKYNDYLSNSEEEGAVTLILEDLSVNYLNGDKIDLGEDDNEKVIEFSITSHATNEIIYQIDLTDISGNFESATYSIEKSNGSDLVLDKTFSETSLASRVTIMPEETHRYKMTIKNLAQAEFSFKIETDIVQVDNGFWNTILANTNTSDNPATTFDIVPAAEGLIKKPEQHGDIYYFRGDVKNNYVSFAGQMWRIVKINEDNTVKLILDGTTETMIKMNDTEEKDLTFQNTSLYSNLEQWYNLHLQEYDDLIAHTKYCYDNSIITDENNRIEYLSNVRLFQDYQPTNACGGTTFTSKFAILTADEAMYAGINSKENKTSYLYVDGLERSWWTMTPNKKEEAGTFYIVVSESGILTKDIAEATDLFLRPVITLVKKVEVSGTGTQEDPYIITNR